MTGMNAASDTPFADQVESELRSVYTFWDHFRTNPVVLEAIAAIQGARAGR